MKPYYEDSFCTIYHGDARDILPQIQLGSYSCITDPVWPNAKADLFGKEDPGAMLHEVTQALAKKITRIAIQLGCDSDPRFLIHNSSALKFFRVCWLEYACPSHKGRLLYGSDVAYLFGEPPKSRAGLHLIPGRMIDSSANGKQANHPCPRKLSHVAWLVRIWSEPSDTIIDPFLGAGTTLLATKNSARKAIGIEAEERYCEEAVKRLQQEVFAFSESSQSSVDLGKGGNE